MYERISRTKRARFLYETLIALLSSVILSCVIVAGPVHAAFIVPIAGHSPQVLVSLTTERDPDDINFAIVNSSSISAPHTMPVGSAPHYEVATWDTGSPAHLLSRDAYDSFDVAGAGKSGAFETLVNNIPAIASDPLGIYVGGFGTVTQTSPSLVVDTGPFMGQYNTSVLYAPAGDTTLPTVVGTPLSSQYTSVYDYANPRIITIDGKEYRSPAVTIAQFDALPDPTRRLQLDVAPGQLGDPPSFFTSLANFDDFGDDPSAPTVGPSYFLDANITHGVNSRDQLEMLYDTGSQGSFVSQQVAATLGFDVINDEPDFVVRLQTISGTTEDVPGFFADELELPGTDGGLVCGLTPLVVFNLPDPRSPGNVLDGLIGQNVLADRTVMFDPDPATDLGDPPPFLGLSDSALDNHDWNSTAASASFGNASSWMAPGTPALDWIAHVENNASFDQTAVVESDATISALNVVGDAEKMTVSIDASATLTVFGTVIVTDNGELHIDGGSVAPLGVEIRGGSLTGHGEVGGEVISSALVAPGDSAGVLHFLGNFDLLSQGTLAMELGGSDNSAPGAAQFDQVLIDGMAGFGGTLDLSLIDLAGGGNPFQPVAGDTFEIITYDSRLGRFETFNADDALSLHYNDTRVLAIAEELSGPFELAGEFDVPAALTASGAWTCSGLLVKRGEGQLTLALGGGFTAGVSSELEIVEGSVRLEGIGSLELSNVTVELDGGFVCPVRGNATDANIESGLLDVRNLNGLTIDEDLGAGVEGADAIGVEWIPLPPDPGNPADAARSMFGGVYTVAKYTGADLTLGGTMDNADGNIGAAYIKSVKYAEPVGGVKEIQIELHPQGIGDTDLDGVVGPADLADFGLGWSPAATDKTWFDGDFDFNGNVDPADLAAFGLAWAPNGIQFPADPGVSVIPEPSTLVMLLIAMAGVLISRRIR